MKANQFPRGLLSLLGASSMGTNVDEVANVLSPVIDVGDNYHVEKLEMALAGVNPVLGGFNAMITIPTGECWKLFQCQAFVTNGVGVTIGGYAAGLQIGGLQALLSNPRAVAASTTDWNVSILNPIWLPAGAALGIFTTLVVGAPIGSFQATVSKFRA